MAAIRLGSPAVRKLEEPLLQDSLVLVSLYLTECCIRDIVRSIGSKVQQLSGSYSFSQESADGNHS